MPLQSSSVSIDAMSNQTKIWAFILGPILAVVVYYLMPDQFVNTSGQNCPFHARRQSLRRRHNANGCVVVH